MGKHSQYGVILDAGSSGTRVYVYKWKNPARASAKAEGDELHSLPKLKLKESKKIHPGVSTFAGDPGAVGPVHLQQLLDVAYQEIPEDKISETPIFLLATAGVRFLPPLEQGALLGSICDWLQRTTSFDLPDCSANVQVISGETEGLYGWVAANYLLGGFDHPQGETIGTEQSHHHTYGFLDMGGASAQIAFAPNSTEAEKHADDLKLVRMRHLDGSPAEYKVFTTTWLGFGANKARERYVEAMQEQYSEFALELPDPCMPKGLRTDLAGLPINSHQDTSHEQIMIGTGQFEECLRLTYPLLEKDVPCKDEPCLINGQHVPAIDFNINHFVGVSEYWHTTHGVFGGKEKAYDLETYQHQVTEYCSRDWEDIEADVLDKRKKSPERKAEDAREACFKASWLINMLYDGIGIPRLGLEAPPANNSRLTDPFLPVNKIDGVELSWTLGKMVLYAAGQVPGGVDPLPVGFGTNVASGKPKDFEPAGSIPLMPYTGHLGDDDPDFDDLDDDEAIHNPRNGKGPFGGVLALVIILVVVGLLFRRPERRRKFWNIARRRLSGSGRKPGRFSLPNNFPLATSLQNNFPMTSKLFGRSPHYERVMEEGEAAQFELSAGESDENDQSDGSESSRATRSAGAGTPRLDAGRFNDELQPPSTMDRHGLAVRTESRERLVGVGRRSRTGSPQRQKSSLGKSIEHDA